MAESKKYDSNTMPFDVLIAMHSRGDQIACPKCGADLQISTEPRRMAFCAIDRRHFHIMPSTIQDRQQLDRLFPPATPEEPSQ